MKPVFKEEYISKLKSIIDSEQGIEEEDIQNSIEELESSLKSKSDDKEISIFIYGSAAMVVAFALVLMYTTKASWPLMFIIVWIGGFMYYRVHDQSLVIDTLQKQRLIDPNNPIPKMDYLMSLIDLKTGLKDVLKIYLSIMLSSTVMMAHRLFIDSSVTLNMFLLIGAIIASYFFWNNFYKEDIAELENVKEEIQMLKSKLILERRYQL